MPKTRSQIQAEIHDALTARGIDRSDSAVRRMAVKWHKRESETGEPLEFFEGLRILGIITDTTARDAVANLEKVKVAA